MERVLINHARTATAGRSTPARRLAAPPHCVGGNMAKDEKQHHKYVCNVFVYLPTYFFSLSASACALIRARRFSGVSSVRASSDSHPRASCSWAAAACLRVRVCDIIITKNRVLSKSVQLTACAWRSAPASPPGRCRRRQPKEAGAAGRAGAPAQSAHGKWIYHTN